MGVQLKTRITEMLGIDFPVIAAPMFLVSNPELVAAVSEVGGLGTFPALNYRTPEQFEEALKVVKSLTDKPYGVNIITNKSNIYQEKQLEICIRNKVPVIITSLGSPKQVITEAHKIGTKVFCDVTNLEYAKKVESLGADAVVAVGYGAGGHAGKIVGSVLVPWLVENLSIPVIAAGGIADGKTLLSALALGAESGYLGTRFIACTETAVNDEYKNSIVASSPEDIVLTARVTGTHANFINTPYLEGLGTELGFFERFWNRFSFTRKWFKMYKGYRAMKGMEKSASGDKKKAWKDVWSAGQTVGLIKDTKPAADIVREVVREYSEAKNKLP
ncbi:MAG: nitronate monooxygenase [Holophagae bacterium]|nr:nitronate monooxygenase [Holophagae bacterium]